MSTLHLRIVPGLQLVLLLLLVPLPALALSSSVFSSRDGMMMKTTTRKKMIRPLPDKLLIAYTTEGCRCNNSASSLSHPPAVVRQALQDGVNVLIWSFFEITQNNNDDGENRIHTNSLGDLDCIKQVIHKLDQEGYTDTLHLTSFGGWNGPHLDIYAGTAQEWYTAWKEQFGGTFHGIDWDLEGHDDLTSPTNEFSVACLDKMGLISQYAATDGYCIGVAPPQSYLDVSHSNFSRRVNLTRTPEVTCKDTSWHDDFSYHGANVYAHLLAKFGAYVDFVSIQFYESYSRAGRHIHHHRVIPANYLQSYVNDLVDQGESFAVDFSEDPDLHLPNQRVSFPLSKLVWGFANGWALNKDIVDSEKTVYFPPASIETAYRALVQAGRAPRGFMFWVLGEEGTNGVFYARALYDIMHLQDKVESPEPLHNGDDDKNKVAEL